MQFLIQSSGLLFDALDHNVEPLVRALDELGVEKYAIGIIPIENIITGLENIDPNKPTMFYGSTLLVELSQKLKGFKPGVFYEANWFDPMLATQHRDDLLCPRLKYITVEELRKDWIIKPQFFKSVIPKVLSGMVLEGPDKEWWLEEYAYLKNDDLLVMGDVKPIRKEWRFFIVNNKVISGSQYKSDGCLWTTEPISSEVWKIAEEMALKWLPYKNIVMDICLSNGEYKLLEFNCLNASGAYKSDWKKIVKALQENYE